MPRPRKILPKKRPRDAEPLCAGVGAERVFSFFRHLTHFQGVWAGKPFTLLPWQRTVIEDVFGRLRPDGTRQRRTAFVELSRKSGKTCYAAGLALYLLLGDQEPGAQVFCVAGDRDQARLVFETAQHMVEASPVLRRMVRVRRHDLYVPTTRSTFRVLSADAPTKHGLNASGIIFDELHVQPNRDLWDALTTSTGARRQPLVLAITTAGFDRTSICYELHDYARKILDGVITDPSFFAFIAAAPPDADWQDPATWALANPSLGVTISHEYLAQEARRAAEMPSYQNTFRRLHLCQWTEQSTRFIDQAVWTENAGPPLREADLAGRACFGGLDMSTSQDLTAWVLVFPSDDDPDEIQVLPRFWCPEARLRDTSNRYRAQYVAWAREGLLQTTPGEAIAYAFVRQAILEDAQRFRLVELAMDAYFQGYQLGTELEHAGLRVAMVRTGMLSMSPPTKELERRLVLRKVRHGGHPILRWMADNVQVRTDHVGNIMPDKASSQSKIDGVVALLLALDRVMRRPQSASVYERRGVLVI